MNIISEKEIKRYLKDTRSAFPICSKLEKRYLKDLSNDIREYLDAHPKACMDDIFDKYGTPNDNAQEYLGSIYGEDLKKALSTNRLRRRVLVAVCICMLIALIAWISFLYQGYITTQNATVREIETVIE